MRRLAAILVILWGIPALEAEEVFAAEEVFYVAPTGDDQWSGRTTIPASGGNGPFATVERAVEAARAAKIKVILLAGGHYQLTRTLILTAEDKGLRIAAIPGERPVLSGGEPVGGFKAEAGGVFAAPLDQEPGLDVTVAGVRLQAARSGDYRPDDPTRSGWFIAAPAKGEGDKRRIRFAAGAVDPRWAQAGVRVQALDRDRMADDIIGIQRIDVASQTLTLERDAWYALREGSTFRLLGHPDFLKHPGQFAWRANDKRLLVLPADPASFARGGMVEVARLTPLVRLNGVTAVTMEGLAFEDVPYSGMAIRIEGGGDNRIINNRFNAVGEAVQISGSTGNELRGNVMEHLGQNGIDVKPGSHGTRILANTIRGVGEVRLFSAGVFVSGSNKTEISHNDIAHAARYGVSLKNWNPETINRDSVIAYNRIRDTARETADAGAIEMLGRSDADTRTVIRYNDIRQTGGLATDAAGRWLERYKGFGVYLDDLTNGVTVEDNFLMDTGWAGVFIHGGDGNKVRNNIAVLMTGKSRFVRLEWVPKAGAAGLLHDNTIAHNLVLQRVPMKNVIESLTGGQPLVEANIIDRFGQDGAKPARDSPGRKTSARASAQAPGEDGSPYFIDPARDDFRLRPTSPARAAGIEDLPWSRIGPKGYAAQ